MKKTNSFFKFYKLYFSKYNFQIIISVILALFAGFTTAIGPRELGKVTTEIVNGIIRKVYGTGGIDFEIILRNLTIIAIIYLSGTFVMIVQGKLVSNIVQKAIANLKNNIAKKINKLPISYFENKEEKEIFSVLNKDLDMISSYFNFLLNEVLTCFAIFIMVVIVMFSISAVLTIITLIIIPTLLILTKGISKTASTKMKKAYAKNNKLDNYVEEIFYRKKLINTINDDSKLENKFNNLNNSFKRASSKAQFGSMIMGPFMALIGHLDYLATIIVGTKLTIRGIIMIGDIQTFIYYNNLLVRPMYMIGEISNIIFSIIESLNRIFDFLELEEIKEDKNNLKIAKGNISFENLEFSYYDNEKVINDISFEVASGQRIAIVGKTGVGKTTIIKLLMKFYDNYSGSIKINDIELNSIDKHELRDKIGVVLQSNWLFTGTIKENIKYGKEDATDSEIIEAAKIAQVHDFIESLPDKYETLLDETNSNISSGQRQLICIARMIIKKPDIILLDEATNLIDVETEKKLQKAIREIMKDKTCITVAHRLSTIVDADNIIVLDKGKIVEQGKHEKLMNNRGLYYEMYQNIIQ